MPLLRLADTIESVAATVARLLDAPATLAARAYVGWVFVHSGLLKVMDWEQTQALFETEYHVPLLPPHVAAVAGAGGELLFGGLVILGLLGRTGSGKTTLTRLLFRLYDTTGGEIRLGGKPLRDLPIQELRRRVGMVTQNIQLFHATVRENLTFFDDSIPDDAVLQALRDLGLWDWYESLPNGLDTELESGGGGLSAGEAQLLAFTRIFLRDPGLIILDEATSRLDPATEHRIEQAVDKLVQNRTAIIVAHRLGTVQRADDILILDDGQVLESGERETLAADPQSRFYHLLQTGMEEVLA